MPKRVKEEPNRQIDLELDKELENTFPASDPLKITRRPPARTSGTKQSRKRTQT